MCRSTALAALAVFSMATFGCGPTPEGTARPVNADDRPNIVLIIIDTLRADALGSYGNGDDTSPELDALARRGVRFSRVVAQSSWTRPSIGSLLTSRQPRALGIYKQPEDSLSDDHSTLPEVLHEHGYTTIGVTANPNINTAYNFDQGFDHYQDSTVLWKWMEASEGVPTKRDRPLPGARETLAGLIAQAQAHGKPPYYLQATLMEVHEYGDERLDFAPFDDAFEGLPFQRYLQAVRFLSAEIARFVEALSALPGWERTLFAITSDHGEGLASHPRVPGSGGHGRLLYESQILVPWILVDTHGDLPGRTAVDDPVRLLDLAPTLLDYAGIDRPPEMEGESLLSRVRSGGDSGTLPARFVVETEQYGERIGIYAGPWEYFVHADPHPGTDPRELQRAGSLQDGSHTNRIHDSPEIARELAEFLNDWLEQHPRAPVTPRTRPLDPIEIDQLRALGYVD